MSEQEQKKRKYGGRGGGGGRRGGGGGRGGGGEGDDKNSKKARYFTQGRVGTGQAVPLGTQGILVTCDAGREDRAGTEAVALIEEHYDSLTDPTAVAAPAPAAAAAEGKSDAAGEAAAAGGDGEAAATDGDGKADAADGKAAAADAADGKAAAAAAADGKAADAEEGKTAAGGGEDAGGGGGGGGGSLDVAAMLAAEVAQLKNKKAARFRVHNTGVKGCIYVIFPANPVPGAPGPIEVATAIAKEAKQRKQVRGRFIVRFLPVTVSCFAGLDEIRGMAPKLLAPHFPEGDDAAPVEFSVEYEHRSAEGFERLDVINAFTSVIKTPPHKVNLKSPAMVVLVQLIRNGCAMAVLPSYRELAKFNVRKLAEVEEAEA